jgi:hypothetical protein
MFIDVAIKEDGNPVSLFRQTLRFPHAINPLPFAGCVVSMTRPYGVFT